MFGSPNVLLSYNARLRRVRVHFLASECFKSRKPPGYVQKKIEERLADERESGHIETYDLFMQRFQELWTHIRSLKGKIDGKREICFTIAQGGRIYQELEIQASPDEQALAFLSCRFSPQKMLSVPFNTFVFNVIRRLNALHVTRSPDRAQLRFLYLLLKHGRELKKVPLRARPMPQDYVRLTKLVNWDPHMHYASLHIFDPRWLDSEASCKRLLQESLRELKELSGGRHKLTFLNKHSLEKLHSLISKMQAIGFHMPYDLLIAYDTSYGLDASVLRQEKALAQHDKADLPRWKMRLGSLRKRPAGDYFQVEIDKDGMKASITSVEKLALALVKDKIDLGCLARELEKQRIVFGSERYLEPLWQAIQKDQPLVGMTVAEGESPEPGSDIFLHFFGRGEDEGGDVDVREAQNAKLVRAGEAVAELRYRDGQAGTSVEGKICHARCPTGQAGIFAGDGIRLKADDIFYAERDGLLAFDGSVLSCEKVYVHKGSINLASGNLLFEGAVIIEGDIESGSAVQVNGNLLVQGMIASAKVICSGRLEVKGGIVTGDNGYVHASGDLSCAFIENSQVQVKGTLTVQRSIMHSRVVTGGNVIVSDGNRGVIAGGSISSWSAIRVARCGMPQGQTTECRIGSDYASELRLLHLSRRMRLMAVYQEEQVRAMEVLEKSLRSTDPVLERLQAKLKRVQKILDKTQGLFERLEKHLHWNHDATLVVSGNLDKNVRLVAAGQKIVHNESLQGVLVSGIAVRGSHILDLDEREAFQKSHPMAMFA